MGRSGFRKGIIGANLQRWGEVAKCARQGCLYSDPGGHFQSQYWPNHLPALWLWGVCSSTNIKGSAYKVEHQHHGDHSARNYSAHGEHLDIPTMTITMEIWYNGHWASVEWIEQSRIFGKRNWLSSEHQSLSYPRDLISRSLIARDANGRTKIGIPNEN